MGWTIQCQKSESDDGEGLELLFDGAKELVGRCVVPCVSQAGGEPRRLSPFSGGMSNKQHPLVDASNASSARQRFKFPPSPQYRVE